MYVCMYVCVYVCMFFSKNYDVSDHDEVFSNPLWLPQAPKVQVEFNDGKITMDEVVKRFFQFVRGRHHLQSMVLVI